MIEEVLSQYYPKFNEQADLMKQILREGQEQTIVAQIQDRDDVTHLSELKMRHTFDKKENLSIVDQIRKKLKLNNQEAHLKCIDNIQGITVQTDAKYNSKFYLENSFYLSKSLDAIKKNLIQAENERIAKIRKTHIQMRRYLNIWFEKSQETKNDQFQPQQTLKKGQIPPYQLIIKQNNVDGLQVSGIITTKMGYKMNYPTLGYVLKATDIPEQTNTAQFIKTIRPLNSVDLDQLEDLKRYVWKHKQYIQFFKVLLKVAQGNLEISETLVKTQQRMKTGFYHVMTFYHISNRSWSICRLIKDLNKKGLYPREKANLYDTMIQNIQEDLEEIFSPLLIKDDWVPIEEQFISFDQYKKRLQEVILVRESNQ